MADNSNFRQFVAQAGIGGMHGTQAYAGDRWKLLSGTVTGTANSNGDGYRNITLNGTICQIVSNPEANMTAFVGTISGTATAVYADGELTITSSGGVLDWVLLLPGGWDNAPNYVPKGYVPELLECQRYCFPIRGGIYLNGFATDGSTLCLLINTPVRMRSNPSLTAPLNVYTFLNGVAEYISNWSLNGVFDTGVGLKCPKGQYTHTVSSVAIAGYKRDNDTMLCCDL